MRYHCGFYPTAPSGSSLDRHRFRQIAWLVYIGAFYDSYMIGKQLHRHAVDQRGDQRVDLRSEEHTSELQSLMRTSYAVFCLQKKKKHENNRTTIKQLVTPP